MTDSQDLIVVFRRSQMREEISEFLLDDEDDGDEGD